VENADRARAEYRPLSIAQLANAGVSVLGQADMPAAGKVLLRGLPFDIATDEDKCFLTLGRGFVSDATIPVGESVQSVVFAHRVLESPILEGGPVGTPVVELSFEFADGSMNIVTLRDRFEIATLPVRWGQLPFAAFPDRFDRLPARYAGRFEDAGIRQTEAGQAWARDYWLWAWVNPTPDVQLRAVKAHALGSAFVIAGLCLGTAVEHPLRLPAARTVLIEIDVAASATASRPGEPDEEPLDFDDHAIVPRTLVEFSVDVDRGFATFPYTVPADRDSLMQDDLVGFGRKLNPMATPAYANVAATDSATISVSRGDDILASVPWAEITEGTQKASGSVQIKLADPGRNWIRTDFVDGDTGEPLACRVHFSSEFGVPYAPHGHHAHVGSDLGTWHRDVGGDVRLGNATYAYVDGHCEGWLPRGNLVIDAACGFEYEPLRALLRIAPGQRHQTVGLKRVRNLRREGWYGGDTHVHFLSTQGAHLEARGEGLSVVNLLASQWGHLFTGTEEFTGEASVSRDGQTIVYASQENRQHVLGHLTLLGLKHAVMPWCTDGAEEAELGGGLEATLSEWADRCHEQGGTVILPHLPNPNGEPAALIATGRADAVELLEANPYNHLEYYRYLNGGYRIPLVGGTDKMSSDVPVGLCRTYVNIPDGEEFSYEAWRQNLARGRTFVSTGPLISLAVEGATPGETVFAPVGAKLEVLVQATSIFPMHTLELIHQGEVVESTTEPSGAGQLSLKTRVPIRSDSWIAARVGGPGYFDFIRHRDLWSRGIMAHTSPVYVTCGEQYDVFSHDTAQYMLTLIDGSLTYIRNLSPQYPAGHATHHHAEGDHIAHLTRPLEEARDRILGRLASHQYHK
jgi:hypothetical protein